MVAIIDAVLQAINADCFQNVIPYREEIERRMRDDE